MNYGNRQSNDQVLAQIRVKNSKILDLLVLIGHYQLQVYLIATFLLFCLDIVD